MRTRVSERGAIVAARSRTEYDLCSVRVALLAQRHLHLEERKVRCGVRLACANTTRVGHTAVACLRGEHVNLRRASRPIRAS